MVSYPNWEIKKSQFHWDWDLIHKVLVDEVEAQKNILLITNKLKAL